jgi:hypothetical protein
MTSTMDTLHEDLDSRLDTIGWGFFFVMSGVVLLVPGLPDGSWLAGVGAILVGFSAVRLVLGLPVSGFATILGIVLFASGAGTMAGLAVPWFSLLLVLCGVALVVDEVVRRKRHA